LKYLNETPSDKDNKNNNRQRKNSKYLAGKGQKNMKFFSILHKFLNGNSQTAYRQVKVLMKDSLSYIFPGINSFLFLWNNRKKRPFPEREIG